jgi:hypothetical protein
MKIKIILFALFLATQVQAQTKVWFDTDLDWYARQNSAQWMMESR